MRGRTVIIMYNKDRKKQFLETLKDKAETGRANRVFAASEEPEILTGYTHLWNHAQKDGYSGTAILLKDEPLQIMRGFGPGDPDEEGRLLTVELPSFLSTHMSQTRKKIYGGMTFG